MNAAIIGCGAVAQTHADVLKRQGVNVAALCDTDESRAAKLNEKYGFNARVYACAEDIPAGELDSVHICTPHYLHAEQAAHFLRLGVNVLSEKPAGICAADVRLIKQAAAESGAVYGVCFQNRYLKRNRLIKELIGGDSIVGAKGFVVWKREAPYYTRSGWRGRKSTEGGSVMLNQAIHTLDLLLDFCGMPDKVSASVGNRFLEGVIDTENTAEAVLSCKNGAKIIFYATTASYSDSPVQLEILTDKHDVAVFRDKLIVDGGIVEAEDEVCGLDAKQYWGAGHFMLIEDFYRCLSCGESFPIGIEEAEKSLMVIDAIYASRGKEVDVEGEYA